MKKIALHSGEMMKNLFLIRMVLLIGIVATASHALPRPPAPTISGVTFDPAAGKFTVNSTMAEAVNYANAHLHLTI